MKMKTIMESFRQKMQEAESDYEPQTEEDYIEAIRDYSKELTGSRDDYGNMDKIGHMDLEQLKDYYEGMSNSPEAQYFADKEQDLGLDSEFDRLPKQVGMGRGLEEKLQKGELSND